MFDISVVIPAYNADATLERAVYSALMAGAAEVVTVDDASTDRTSSIGNCLKNTPEILYLRNNFKSGVIYSRNRAIYAANYDLILPLDADDKLLTIAPLHEAIKPHTWVYGGWQEDGQDYEPPPPGMLHSKELGWISMLFWKEDWKTVGGYDPDFSIGNEIWAFQRALVCAGVMPIRVPDIVFERDTYAPLTEKARQWAHIIRPLIDAKYPYPR